MKHQISLASLVLVGLLATGCSQQQVQEAPAKPVEDKNVPTPAPAPVPSPAPAAPAPVANPDCHTHPRNALTKSVTHCHKNPRGQHRYGGAKPAVDVSKLQAKLKAKGYYKGPINGVIDADTRAALEKFKNK